MEDQPETTEHRPAEALRVILTRWRDLELGGLGQGGRDETVDAATVPGDEMDLASSIVELEMRASLVERHQQRLKAIGAAFERLREGLYGICEQCGEEISIERLRVLPLATNCVDCQTERETEVRRTIGDERRAAPVRIDEILETEHSIEGADSDPDRAIGSALDADQEEFKTPRKGTRRRGPNQEPALGHAPLEDRSKVTGGTRSAFVEGLERRNPKAIKAGESRSNTKRQLRPKPGRRSKSAMALWNMAEAITR